MASKSGRALLGPRLATPLHTPPLTTKNKQRSKGERDYPASVLSHYKNVEFRDGMGRDMQDVSLQLD